MEETPLLGGGGGGSAGHWRKTSLSLIPSLFNLPEGAPLAFVAGTPERVSESVSNLKDLLIFGLPDTSPQLGDYTALVRRFANGPVKEASFHGGSGIGIGSDVRLDVEKDETEEKEEEEEEEDENERTNAATIAATTTTTTTAVAPLRRKKRSFQRSRTAPALTVLTERMKWDLGLEKEPSPPLVSSITVVQQAFIGLALYLFVGVMMYVWKADQFSGSSTHIVVDAIYFCIVTMCTIGYGDITPLTPSTKLFSCAFVLVGFGFIDILLSGMVNFVLDRQETLLLQAVQAGRHKMAKNYLVDVKKSRMRIRMKVTLAFGVVVLCIGVGSAVMCTLENLTFVDALYLSCMSVTTVGYGDHAFNTLFGRLFASVWLLISTLAVARSFLYLAEARIDKRHRLIAKWVLEKEMTVGDLVAADLDNDGCVSTLAVARFFLYLAKAHIDKCHRLITKWVLEEEMTVEDLVAADLDNDGCVSKSDFVVYKLKQMGKIEEKEISEISEQFNRLDTENSGKIRLSYLLNLHDAIQNSVAEDVIQ